MKAVNSSSYSSPSSLNIMIPQFQQLLPLETPLSGSWSNTNYSSESLSTTTHKLLMSPVSITPTSVCTDLLDSEYHPIDLSSHKYSLSSPPLSNTKSDSMDFIDCTSPDSKQELMMIISNPKKKSSFKTNRQCSNFSIEHLLSSSYRSPTYEFLSIRYRQTQSIFTKKTTKHFSDHYLHRIIHHKRRRQSGSKSFLSQYSTQPQGIFLRYIFDFCNDLINQQNQIKKPENFFSIDALEQLAEIACKLDTRHKKSLVNENVLSLKTYDFLLEQCHRLITRIYQKYQDKKIPKRLDFNSKLILKKRFLHFSLSLLNILQRKKNILLPQSNHTNCHILLSDMEKKKKKTNEKTNKSICFHLKSDQIKSNLEILIPHNGLLYEATIQPMDNYDDLLLVRLQHERQTYLIPIHDLCRLACPKMIPEDFNVLSKGLRVCAYWSTSLRGLHPAIIEKVASETNESSMIGLIFDDGDTGLIKRDEIRLLPDNFDMKGINLDEWRVSSFQIPSSLPMTRRTCRRVSSTSSIDTKSFVKKVKTSSIVIPRWTINVRNSTIRRHDNKEIIRVGDCVVLHGVDNSLSYIGKVLKFSHKKSIQQDLVRIQWYYSPKETPIEPDENDLPGALYESTHIDENPIATIRYKGTIYGSYDDYVKKTDYGKKRKETDFYLVGHYNPTSGKVQRYDD